MRQVEGRAPEGCSRLVLLAGRRSRACFSCRAIGEGKGLHDSRSQIVIFPQEDDLGLPATCENLVTTPSGS